MTGNDHKIWLKVKKKEIGAFELLYKKYFTPLCLHAYSIITHKEIATEIVNDIFLKIWRESVNIEIDKGIKPYLYRSVHNACLDYLKSKDRARLNNTIVISEKIKELIFIDEGSILDILSFQDVEKEVMKSINQLPPQCKEVFLLSRFELMTYREISEKLNISVNTVKTQMVRALNSLKISLKKYL